MKLTKEGYISIEGLVDIEFTVELYGNYEPAERQTRDHPGSNEACEWTSFEVLIADDVPYDVKSAVYSLVEKAFRDPKTCKKVEAEMLEFERDNQATRMIDANEKLVKDLKDENK